jgi:hypothetical protein
MDTALALVDDGKALAAMQKAIEEEEQEANGGQQPNKLKQDESLKEGRIPAASPAKAYELLPLSAPERQEPEMKSQVVMRAVWDAKAGEEGVQSTMVSVGFVVGSALLAEDLKFATRETNIALISRETQSKLSSTIRKKKNSGARSDNNEEKAEGDESGNEEEVEEEVEVNESYRDGDELKRLIERTRSLYETLRISSIFAPLQVHSRGIFSATAADRKAFYQASGWLYDPWCDAEALWRRLQWARWVRNNPTTIIVNRLFFCNK